MRPNILCNKLRAGEVLLGLAHMYPAAGSIEGMCKGWDYVWIDVQHGEHSYDSVLQAMWAAGATGIETIIRVPSHETGTLGKYADLCPSAIMVPMVETADQAGAVVQGLRFPPLGNRSYGGRRVIDLDGRDFYKERELLVVAQIETLESVEAAKDIIATEGIDMLFFGPDDMKLRMGLNINTKITENADVRKSMERTANAARAAGKFAGCVAVDPAGIKMATELGYQFIVGGGDVVFLRTMSASKLTELRDAVKGKVIETGAKSAGFYGT